VTVKGGKTKDWMGRSQEYRNTISKMYLEAGIPRAVDKNITAAIRYHVRKLAWDEATPGERKLLEMKDPYNPLTSASSSPPSPPKTPDDVVELTVNNAREQGAERVREMVIPVEQEDNPVLWTMTLLSMAERIEKAETTKFEDRAQMLELIEQVTDVLARIYTVWENVTEEVVEQESKTG
jgi:hypothetical protein